MKDQRSDIIFIIFVALLFIGVIIEIVNFLN